MGTSEQRRATITIRLPRLTGSPEHANSCLMPLYGLRLTEDHIVDIVGRDVVSTSSAFIGALLDGLAARTNGLVRFRAWPHQVIPLVDAYLHDHGPLNRRLQFLPHEAPDDLADPVDIDPTANLMASPQPPCTVLAVPDAEPEHPITVLIPPRDVAVFVKMHAARPPVAGGVGGWIVVSADLLAALAPGEPFGDGDGVVCVHCDRNPNPELTLVYNYTHAADCPWVEARRALGLHPDQLWHAEYDGPVTTVPEGVTVPHEQPT